MSRKLPLSILAGLAALLPAATAVAAAVGVSVNVGQPGFYGRIDIGQVAPPVIYAQPMMIAPHRVADVQRPIYLRVPPGHAKNWSKHCARYSACGQQTYFVREDWYRDVYAPSRVAARPDMQHRPGHAPIYRETAPRYVDRGHDRGYGRDHGYGPDRGYGPDYGHGRGKAGKGHRD